MKLRFDERLLMQRREDAEDDKLMRLCRKQLRLAFGDFSQLHKWRGRAPAKGRDNGGRKATRFKEGVVKEWKSASKCSRRQGDSDVGRICGARGLVRRLECSVAMYQDGSAAPTLATRAKHELAGRIEATAAEEAERSSQSETW
jgi:hypothetical protein